MDVNPIEFIHFLTKSKQNWRVSKAEDKHRSVAGGNIDFRPTNPLVVEMIGVVPHVQSYKIGKISLRFIGNITKKFVETPAKAPTPTGENNNQSVRNIAGPKNKNMRVFYYGTNRIPIIHEKV
jgi:hypothetical protein